MPFKFANLKVTRKGFPERTGRSLLQHRVHKKVNLCREKEGVRACHPYAGMPLPSRPRPSDRADSSGGMDVHRRTVGRTAVTSLSPPSRSSSNSTSAWTTAFGCLNDSFPTTVAAALHCIAFAVGGSEGLLMPPPMCTCASTLGTCRTCPLAFEQEG